MIALRFVAKFVLVSLPLTWFWFHGGAAYYAWLLHHVGGGFYSLIGLDGLQIPIRARFINFIPFIALVVATPRLTNRRRILGILGGLVVFFVSHLTINAMTELSGRRHVLLPEVAGLSDALPLGLWVIVAYPFVREITTSIAAPLRVPEATDQSGQ